MRLACAAENGSNVNSVLSLRSATSDASPPEQLSDTILRPDSEPPLSKNFSVSSSSAGVCTVATP